MVVVNAIYQDGRVTNGSFYTNVKFIVDTGATHSAIPQDIADGLKLQTLGPVSVETGGGIQQFEHATASITIFDITKEYKLTIIPKGMPAVLGLDVMSATGCIVDPKSMKLECLLQNNVKQKKWVMYAGIAILCILIPVIAKIGFIGGDALLYLAAFTGNLGGSSYIMFQAWLKKLDDIRAKAEASMSKGETPPDAKTEMVHGIKFNKNFYIYMIISVMISFGIAIWLTASNAVTVNVWYALIPANFGTAAAATLALKNIKLSGLA